MADDNSSSAEDTLEIEPVDEEKVVRREIQELRPKDPSPEVNDPEPPKLTIGGVLNIVKKKGLLGALSDDAWGPHVHLVFLLCIISTIAIIIAIIRM